MTTVTTVIGLTATETTETEIGMKGDTETEITEIESDMQVGAEMNTRRSGQDMTMTVAGTVVLATRREVVAADTREKRMPKNEDVASSVMD
jgi:hypothetical protein